MDLPIEFLDNMKCILKDEYEDFVSSYTEAPLSGLRVNQNKISVDDFMRIAPYDITPIPFVDNGFYINDNDPWSKHPYYYAGLYYLQEPSAMLPANRLKICKDDKCLDLCAAPGGKSTAIYAKGCKLLVSNDISYTRTLPLVKNLEYAGAGDYFVTCEEPQNLASYFENYFDKILVDAPCSGEGMFRKSPNLIKAWEEKRPQDYTTVQRQILDSAIKMLKPDGLLLYSTCTFSPLEDEDNIEYILNNHEDVELIDIDDYDGFTHGYIDSVKNNSELRKCIHVLPHKMEGEGHFLALLHKKESDANNINMQMYNNPKVVSYNKLPDEVKEFLLHIRQDNKVFVDKQYLVDDKGFVYLLPDEYERVFIKGLHYIRTGILVGLVNKYKKFIPHTAFALWLKAKDYDNVLDLSISDDNVTRYLKGETLIIPNDNSKIKKGIVLIAVDGYSLGFALFDGSKYKNLYEKGWRLV